MSKLHFLHFLILSLLLFQEPSTSAASDPPAHTVLLSACASARHPSLCFSAIASSSPSLLSTLTTSRDVIHASLNLTRTAISLSFYEVNKKLNSNTSRALTHRERTALHDCLDMFDESLTELRLCDKELRSYPSSEKSVARHAEDLEILISGAMTNQESCLDGFSHEEVDRELRRDVYKGIDHVTRMCANSLAMIKNMTEGDVAVAAEEEEAAASGFPRWMEREDRGRVSGEGWKVAVDVVVAKDGSGNFTTVGAAVEAAPEKSKRRHVIGIKEGRYEENVVVGKKKKNIMFVGAGRGKTVITASRNVVDGYTTFKSATLGKKNK